MVSNDKKIKQATCEIEVAFGVIGGKWKPIIIWFLGELGTLRFGQIQHLIPEITHKILTKQLRELEENDLVLRKVYSQIPPKVEYTITDKGRDVLPILDMMCDWSTKNNHFDYELTYNLCEEDFKKTILNDNHQ
jgi:DNA-binding HxlR family transcriptional regulator